MLGITRAASDGSATSRAASPTRRPRVDAAEGSYNTLHAGATPGNKWWIQENPSAGDGDDDDDDDDAGKV